MQHLQYRQADGRWQTIKSSYLRQELVDVRNAHEAVGIHPNRIRIFSDPMLSDEEAGLANLPWYQREASGPIVMAALCVFILGVAVYARLFIG